MFSETERLTQIRQCEEGDADDIALKLFTLRLDEFPISDLPEDEQRKRYVSITLTTILTGLVPFTTATFVIPELMR